MPVERRGQVTDVGSGPTGNRKSPLFSTEGRRRSSLGDTSRMMREYHVRICERLGVKLPGPTRQHCGNAGTRFRQARSREASASEPLQKCRKRIRRCQNRGGDPSSGISSGDALILPERHPACSGAKLDQAFVWNVRTCASSRRRREGTSRKRLQPRGREYRSGAQGRSSPY